jgi:hypothetical protein
MCLACEMDELWALYREQRAAAAKIAGQNEVEVATGGLVCTTGQAASSAESVPKPFLNCEEWANE